MATQIERLVCPCCGFPVSAGDSECPAGHPLNITSINSLSNLQGPMINKYVNTFRKELASDPDNQQTNFELGVCFLKLKFYDRALAAFDKAMVDNFDNSEIYFYAAICCLEGKKAFLTPRAKIDLALKYLDDALMIEDKGIYYYFIAYIKYDYFERKYLNVSPNYKATLQMARQAGVSANDASALFTLLGVDCPSGF